MGERRATDGGVEAVVKLSTALRMLKVRGDTGGEGGSRAVSELTAGEQGSESRLNRDPCTPANRLSFGDSFSSFGGERATFGGLARGCHGWG